MKTKTKITFLSHYNLRSLTPFPFHHIENTDVVLRKKKLLKKMNKKRETKWSETSSISFLFI